MKDLSLKYMFKGAEWSTPNLPIRSTLKLNYDIFGNKVSKSYSFSQLILIFSYIFLQNSLLIRKRLER